MRVDVDQNSSTYSPELQNIDQSTTIDQVSDLALRIITSFLIPNNLLSFLLLQLSRTGTAPIKTRPRRRRESIFYFKKRGATATATHSSNKILKLTQTSLSREDRRHLGMYISST
jgi:hypothetical protein